MSELKEQDQIPYADNPLDNAGLQEQNAVRENKPTNRPHLVSTHETDSHGRIRRRSP